MKLKKVKKRRRCKPVLTFQTYDLGYQTGSTIYEGKKIKH